MTIPFVNKGSEPSTSIDPITSIIYNIIKHNHIAKPYLSSASILDEIAKIAQKSGCKMKINLDGSISIELWHLLTYFLS